jgi:hypothetical protein
MNTATTTWFASSDEGSTDLTCAACHAAIGREPELDHHPRTCPHCGIDCAFLQWGGRVVQVVPTLAPSVVSRLLAYMQNEFDELEYVELMAAMQELMDGVSSAGQPAVVSDQRE